MGDSFNDGSERHCPKCFHYFGYVAYPLLRENLTDPMADPLDRLAAEVVFRRSAKQIADEAIAMAAR